MTHAFTGRVSVGPEAFQPSGMDVGVVLPVVDVSVGRVVVGAVDEVVLLFCGVVDRVVVVDGGVE